MCLMFFVHIIKEQKSDLSLLVTDCVGIFEMQCSVKWCVPLTCLRQQVENSFVATSDASGTNTLIIAIGLIGRYE